MIQLPDDWFVTTHTRSGPHQMIEIIGRKKDREPFVVLMDNLGTDEFLQMHWRGHTWIVRAYEIANYGQGVDNFRYRARVISGDR